MSSDEPNLYPIVVVEDRYGGCYSHGRWFAIAEADKPLEGISRVNWVMENGAGSNDVTCGIFWADPPPWVAVGNTPDEAVASLRAKPDAQMNGWDCHIQKRHPLWEKWKDFPSPNWGSLAR